MGGSPGASKIAAWLASLPDDEVLERILRLQATYSYDPEIMLCNHAALKILLDEAAEFVPEDWA